MSPANEGNLLCHRDWLGGTFRCPRPGSRRDLDRPAGLHRSHRHDTPWLNATGERFPAQPARIGLNATASGWRSLLAVSPWAHSFRLGLTRFAELRLGADGFTSESRLINGEWEQHGGSSDLELGAKARLRDEKVYLPAFAFVAGVSFPTGSGYFSSGRVDPFLELAWSKSLPRGFSAGGNVNFRWGASETEHGYSLSVGHALGHGFASYGEIYRISPIDGDERAHWIANGGITRLLGQNAQLDLEAGHTINARTPHWFLGAGFAIRMHAPGMIASMLNRFH
jgi:hypothetical protein